MSFSSITLRSRDSARNLEFCSIQFLFLEKMSLEKFSIVWLQLIKLIVSRKV